VGGAISLAAAVPVGVRVDARVANRIAIEMVIAALEEGPVVVLMPYLVKM
jgi:hypothetical protein